MLLTGCGNTFRNRAFDYTRTDVKQLPALQTPAGINTPNYHPALMVPPGPNNYTPSGMPDMTPPNYNDAYQIDKKTKQVTVLKVSSSPQATAVKSKNLPLVSSKSPVSSVALSSQIIQTDGHNSVLEISAPYDIAWDQMALAIKKSGYRIVNAEKNKGFYYIALRGDHNDADAVLLYLKANQNTTQAILYNSAGNPDNSANAQLTLKQFSRGL